MFPPSRRRSFSSASSGRPCARTATEGKRPRRQRASSIMRNIPVPNGSPCPWNPAAKPTPSRTNPRRRFTSVHADRFTIRAPRRSGTESWQTLRGRGVDSNFGSRVIRKKGEPARMTLRLFASALAARDYFPLQCAQRIRSFCISGIHAQIAGKGFKKLQRARGNRARLAPHG